MWGTSHSTRFLFSTCSSIVNLPTSDFEDQDICLIAKVSNRYHSRSTAAAVDRRNARLAVRKNAAGYRISHQTISFEPHLAVPKPRDETMTSINNTFIVAERDKCFGLLPIPLSFFLTKTHSSPTSFATWTVMSTKFVGRAHPIKILTPRSTYR